MEPAGPGRSTGATEVKPGEKTNRLRRSFQRRSVRRRCHSSAGIRAGRSSKVTTPAARPVLTRSRDTGRTPATSPFRFIGCPLRSSTARPSGAEPVTESKPWWTRPWQRVHRVTRFHSSVGPPTERNRTWCACNEREDAHTQQRKPSRANTQLRSAGGVSRSILGAPSCRAFSSGVSSTQALRPAGGNG